MSMQTEGRVGTVAWYFQRLSGLALILLIGAHFAVNHFDVGSPAGHGWAEAVERLRRPSYAAMELCLLLLAIWHGFTGLWVVVRDLVPGRGSRAALLAGIWLMGIAVSVVGVGNLLPLLDLASMPGPVGG
jgi:succinate dehydrogenase hydrophobic anchor subunit